MENNFHVLFVHFPIALLSTYALAEFVRLRTLLARPYWFYIKGTFVIFGALAAYLAMALGGLIEDGVGVARPDVRPLIEMHSNFAALTTLVFSFLAGAYLVEWISREFPAFFARGGMIGKFLSILLRVRTFIFRDAVTVLLALLGLIAVTATGALGGAIVFGPTVDPVVAFVYGLVM